MRNAVNKIAALGVATAISVSAIAPTAFAAPVGTRAAQLEKSFAGSVIDVQWRRRGRWVAPAIAGAIIGGAIIAGSRPYGYYDDPPPMGYYYDAPPPPAYYQAPPAAYYEPSPRGGPRQCWVESGPNGATGYWLRADGLISISKSEAAGAWPAVFVSGGEPGGGRERERDGGERHDGLEGEDVRQERRVAAHLAREHVGAGRRRHA